MKATLPSLLCILLTAASVRLCSAEVLVYTYSMQQTTTQTDGTHTLRLSGQLIWDVATTNVTLVTWLAPWKSYFIQPAASYVVVPVPGPGRSHLTAMEQTPPTADASSPTQYLGGPLLGRNSHLKIGTGKYVDLPSLFTSGSLSVSYNPQDASSNSLMQFTRRCVFSPAATQAANNQGQAVDDLVNALVQKLQAQGYSGH